MLTGVLCVFLFQETYGEDPILTSILATRFIHGLQGNHSRYVLANSGCKHFDVHGGPENIPVSRFSFNAQVRPGVTIQVLKIIYRGYQDKDKNFLVSAIKQMQSTTY